LEPPLEIRPFHLERLRLAERPFLHARDFVASGA
jgi:hypothetical protein